MRSAALLFMGASLAISGCSQGQAADPNVQAQMKDGFLNRPNPSTLPPAQQKVAAESKAMAERMRLNGPAGRKAH